MNDGLFWLPPHSTFDEDLRKIKKSGDPLASQLQALRTLSQHNLDFLQAASINRYLQTLLDGSSHDLPFPKVRVALLSSTTIDHLLPSIQMAALRRGFLIDWYIAPFNQYRQEILDSASALYAFKPEMILLLLHAGELSIRVPLDSSQETIEKMIQAQISDWKRWWDLLDARMGAAIIQSTFVVPPIQLFGHLDQTLATAPAHILNQVNQKLREAATEKKIHLMDLEALAARVGKYNWCAPALWHHAKQDIPLSFAPLFGEHAGRILGSIRGLSRKCLVLDLDGTLWGGVIGDDGLENIEIGQGSGVGEAFVAFQQYVKQLQERGVILAVCSKNDEHNALLPFEKHPDMHLTRKDFAVFVANWQDKASNIRQIAAQLNIGLDSIVFFDNDAGERQLVRQLLPMVAVPEAPEDPAEYTLCLSEAGYFEAGAFTKEDQERTSQYHAIAAQRTVQETGGDLSAFLTGLNMEMAISPFDEIGLQRIAQLINKSNQFNLTTRRATEAQVRQLIHNTNILTYQVRLKDRLADHGMISVLIAEPDQDPSTGIVRIHTWLMSCRVLGRQVEQDVLNVLVHQARERGYKRILGEYIPTEKNRMVSNLYERLGFKPDSSSTSSDGSTFWFLDVTHYQSVSTMIKTQYMERITA